MSAAIKKALLPIPGFLRNQETIFISKAFAYDSVQSFAGLTDEEREQIWKMLIHDIFHIPETRVAIERWIAELDRKNQFEPSDKSNFLDEF